MTTHAGVRHFHRNVQGVVHASPAEAGAWVSVVCGHCSESVTAAVIADAGLSQIQWIRCPGCNLGSVINSSVLAPPAMAGEHVDGLDGPTASAYEEARAAMSVDAYTAGELMCRKILMHAAVDKGAEENRPFAYYIDFLADQGYVTPPMRPWVDLIRNNGNEATHELPPVERDRGLGTLAFTAQLLRMMYEMDHKVAQFLPPPPETKA